jgi:hypothetical protein
MALEQGVIDSPVQQRNPVVVLSTIAGLVTLAVVLRVIGIRFGLPAVYNPDEVAIMSRALAFATGDLNPHNFLYPTFYFYALFGWIGGYYVLARLTGTIASVDAFQTQFFTDPSRIYLAGRLLSVTCGAATAAGVFALARRLFCARAGLIAALFIAVAPFHVRDSHYIKHDVPATLAVVLAYVAIARVWSRRTRSASVSAAAAAACGVAFSIHYYTVFLALPLAYAIWFGGSRATHEKVRALALAALIAAATFFVLSPFILIEPATAWRDIAANRAIVIDRAVDSGGWWLPTLDDYARMLWQEAIGWPIVLLAAVGIGWLMTTARSTLWLLLAFPVAFLLFISNTVAAGRYLIPVLPFIAIFAAFAVDRLNARASRRGLRALGAVALAIAACVPSIVDSIRIGRFFRHMDTRSLALRYIEETVRAGATFLVQPYSVPLSQSRASLEESLRERLGNLSRASTKFTLRLRVPPSEPSYRLIYLGDGGLDPDKIYVSYRELGGPNGLAAVRARGVQYIVVKRYNRPDSDTLPFLDALAREGRQLATFSPYHAHSGAKTVEPFLHNTDTPLDRALERPGPVVEIWALGDNAERRTRAPAPRRARGALSLSKGARRYGGMQGARE